MALADRVVADGWPQAFQVPAGLGKTAVLDVAVWALAQQAALPPQQRKARTRTFLIVDRRLVVDQAFDRAQALAGSLGDATAGPLQAVAQALRDIGEPDERRGEAVLSVTRMRGGATWANRWIRRPDLPAVVVGTVDQLGSRALFRGYGVGRRRRPIDAALVGTDALVIIDEVHLSRPCRETLTTMAAYEARVAHPVARPMHLVSMSATLPEPGSETLLTGADWAHPVAGPRLRAEKFARLVRTEARQAPAVLAGLARSHLAALGQSGVGPGHVPDPDADDVEEPIVVLGDVSAVDRLVMGDAVAEHK